MISVLMFYVFRFEAFKDHMVIYCVFKVSVCGVYVFTTEWCMISARRMHMFADYVPKPCSVLGLVTYGVLRFRRVAFGRLGVWILDVSCLGVWHLKLVCLMLKC